MSDNLPANILDYSFSGFIGEGRNGVVYSAFDLKQQRTVAVKLLRVEKMADHHYRTQVIARCNAVAQIDHPNVAIIAGIENVDDQYLIESELISGLPISAAFENKPIDLESFLDVAIQIVSGLMQAHDQMIIHGNIRPENIIINNEGIIKLTDFGLCTPPEKMSNDPAPDALGFLSPEQLVGRPANFVSDLYSIGLVLYELIGESETGRMRPGDDSSRSRMGVVVDPQMVREKGLPGDIVLLMEKLLADNPEDRFANCEQLLVTLEAIAEFEKKQAVVIEPRPSRWSARHYLSVSLLVVLLLILWSIVAAYYK